MAFWVDNNSVFNFKGKDFGFGDEMPAGVAGETLKSLKKKKRVAEKAPATAGSARNDPNDKKLAAAQESLKQLDRANADLIAQRDAAESISAELQERLDSAEEKIGELTQKLGASEKTVTELTDQLTKPSKGGKK